MLFEQQHNYDNYDKESQKFKDQDDRMKYGSRNFSDFMKNKDNKPKPGEVKRYDKKLKRWVSNKK